MQSEYVLLCSPYRYSSVFANSVNRQFIEKELMSVVIPGVNIMTRGLLRTMLETNYGITDYSSLKEEIDKLEDGRYHALEDVSSFIDGIGTPDVKDFYLSLNSLTGSQLIKGFDDCRIIDVLTKSYAARLTTKEEFEELFTKQTERIKNSYQTWEHYLASCVLGKLLQFVPSSETITSVEEYVVDVYSFCIAPTNVFSYGTFWANHELANLTALLENFLPEEIVKELKARQDRVDYKGEIPGLTAPSNDLLASLEGTSIDPTFIDYERYQYLSELADYVFWTPLIENNLEWMVAEKNLQEQDTILLPKEYASLYSARVFWYHYPSYKELHEEHIFAMFEGTLSLNLIFTEEAVYTFKKKLFGKPVLVRIPWEQVELSSSLNLWMEESKIHFGKKTISNVSPVLSEIGLNSKAIDDLDSQERKALENEWQQKMNQFLEGIPQRIREFKGK
ncbi:DUF1266 domain-containing protein [Streptococcus suis]|uniref:DUF1266 domain-containing protein n=1 Tax=Streptococcus suis TaxID=1307 RepID=UPI000F6428DE|nr:DUF1266 domain-containing protein [Streptococcus suis]RRR48931.1 DUF1266 domain-containing protein [Streptococcus suis]HEL2245454.1 DUF1266 domain-containing protein [Streptococcus suis]HEM5157752.1 DUF1266 domain-containing protein [Streptococcus suis]HEM5364234.1 DUF1266 domain-containing protein [Streptococcus suis]